MLKLEFRHLDGRMTVKSVVASQRITLTAAVFLGALSVGLASIDPGSGQAGAGTWLEQAPLR